MYANCLYYVLTTAHITDILMSNNGSVVRDMRTHPTEYYAVNKNTGTQPCGKYVRQQ